MYDDKTLGVKLTFDPVEGSTNEYVFTKMEGVPTLKSMPKCFKHNKDHGIWRDNSNNILYIRDPELNRINKWCGGNVDYPSNFQVGMVLKKMIVMGISGALMHLTNILNNRPLPDHSKLKQRISEM